MNLTQLSVLNPAVLAMITQATYIYLHHLQYVPHLQHALYNHDQTLLSVHLFIRQFSV